MMLARMLERYGKDLSVYRELEVGEPDRLGKRKAEKRHWKTVRMLVRKTQGQHSIKVEGGVILERIVKIFVSEPGSGIQKDDIIQFAGNSWRVVYVDPLKPYDFIYTSGGD